MLHARRHLAALAGRVLRNPPSAGISAEFSKGIFEVSRAEQAFGRSLGFATTATTPVVVAKRGWPRRIGTLAVGTGLVGAAAWVANGEHPVRRATMLYTIPVRLARDVTAAVAMITG